MKEMELLGFKISDSKDTFISVLLKCYYGYLHTQKENTYMWSRH